MLRRLALVATFSLASLSTARAQPGPVQQLPPGDVEPGIVEKQTATWPLVLDMHALIGFEPHDRGTPLAFGAGAELLWRGHLGGFASLLVSEGTPVVPPSDSTGKALPGFGDRISVPFGFALRPFSFSGAHESWAHRLLDGIDVQVGLTVEHMRTSDDSVTTAGLHLGLAVDVPIYGGPHSGGVALRLAGRFIAQPQASLDSGQVFEPATTLQLFAGLAYIP